MKTNRIQLPDDLPLLSRIWPSGDPLPEGHTHSYRLLLALRQIATSLRVTQARRFYSTRTVATHFRIHQTMVVRAYAELEREGLLMRLRGSGTMLSPLRMQPRIPIRGVVGVPIWSYGHSALSDWRVFFTQLEEHLRKRHFVADFIFYRMDEPAEQPDFAERLVAHDLDALIWFKPLSTYTMNLQKLTDGGVKVVVVPEKDVHLPFPAYSPSLDAATLKALAAWKRDGIRSVSILSAENSYPHSDVQRLFRLTSAARLEATLQPVNPDTFASFATTCASKNRGVIFGDDMLCAQLCQGRSEAVVDLLRTHRVLCRQYLEMPRFLLEGCRVDMVWMDWAAFASRLANDLSSGKLPAPHTREVQEARFTPRADAVRFAQSL